ncbi:hypothetical protein JCGZ_13520 [Jatropha curcas]|uniref:Uncharacterized protein n=1 Tax=Jatropha curcas TaxID=180498 RepID=A0A067KNA1_JATCU|nr:hypothetical protein JCGZ_13520 [Jatropha curcas]
MIDFDEQQIKSPEPSFEQLVEGTQFMVDMVQTGRGTEWSQKISEFEDFLGIGDEASRMVQEQKAKARILQSILAAEDVAEAERKAAPAPPDAALACLTPLSPLLTLFQPLRLLHLSSWTFFEGE